jgi:nitrogenase subunit NifH
MINRETIWTETYNRKTICVDGTHVDVLSAINNYDGLYVISRLEICSTFPAGNITANINLTADEMEILASHLMASANYQRKLINMVVADNAERIEAQLIEEAA